MIEYYVDIKGIHIAAAIVSGSLFLARGIAIQCRAGWPMSRPVRYLSYTIDSLLLAAALALVSMLPDAVFANGWLIMKLALVVVYIGLGSFALKRGRTPTIRRFCLLGATLAFFCILAVALSHHPLGPIRVLVE